MQKPNLPQPEGPRAIFAAKALEVAPRILGLGDRDPASPTYGCFDRAWWHYRLSDFPSAWFQSAAYYLFLLHRLEAGAANPWRGRGRLLDWSRAAVGFTLSIAHRDGSLDEAYPNERSYCATAFAACHLSETVLGLGEGLGERSGEERGEELPEGLGRLGGWLLRRANPELSNQEAAAALALANLHLLSGEARFREGAEAKVSGLLERRARHGFFPEYGGLDVGYSSLTVGLLWKYARKTGSKEALAACRAEAGLLEGRIGEDGSFPAWQTSRGVQYVYPLGLAALGSAAASKLAAGLAKGIAIAPGWLDDRYVTGLAIDYLEACEALEEVPAA